MVQKLDWVCMGNGACGVVAALLNQDANLPRWKKALTLEYQAI